eukprot:jgi/Mesen1/8238/ME000443S07387
MQLNGRTARTLWRQCAPLVDQILSGSASAARLKSQQITTAAHDLTRSMLQARKVLSNLQDCQSPLLKSCLPAERPAVPSSSHVSSFSTSATPSGDGSEGSSPSPAGEAGQSEAAEPVQGGPQGFAKALLDVADNLTRASDAVPASYRTAAAAAPVPGGGIGNGNGHSQEQGEGASKLLRSLLEGVLLTEKQLHQTAEGAGRLEPGAAPGGGREEAEAGRDDLIAMLAERDVLLQERQGEVERTKESLLRALAEMENLRARTLREGEAAKKFAIQVFRSHGLQVYDPTGQEFDPNEHMALFEVDDASKKDGTVGAVMKTGYKLHERVIRPAEVGVVKHRSSASS